MSRLTRRQLARYAADQLVVGNQAVIDELAAYLLDQRRVKELELLVSDIENELVVRGVAVAHVMTARTLEGTLRTKLAELLEQELGVDKVYLSETIQPELIGGFKVRAAGREIDASLSRKINQLKTMKV